MTEKEIMKSNDNFESILSDLNDKIEDTYNKNTKIITEQTTKTVKKCEEVRENTENKFKKYFHSRDIFDVVVGLWHVALPIVLIVLLLRK
jgi:hypothetical protein